MATVVFGWSEDYFWHQMTLREFFAKCYGHARYNGVDEEDAGPSRSAPKRASLADIQSWV